MGPVFLHGGGAHPDAIAATLGPFVSAAQSCGDARILLVIHAEVEAHLGEYRAILEAAGAPASGLETLVVAPGDALGAEQLAVRYPAAIFVCGGPAPRYQGALCTDASWPDYVRVRDLPYCGTSAGAAIASERGIVGGWRVRRGEAVTQMVFAGAGEGVEMLDVRPGLGLVPWSVEVHASQMGTLARLLHAVDTGLVGEGWAIDEDTVLTVDSGRVIVRGMGQAYHVGRPGDGTLAVAILTDGETWIGGELPSR